MRINKEIYFDQLQKKLEKVLHGKDLTNREILLWIDQWTTNYEIAKMWRTKQLQPQYICYT